MAEGDEVERDFPTLTSENYRKSSEKDFNYNCLAFVLGDHQNWWEPPGMFGHYWPPGFPEDTTVETVTLIIKTHGFIVDAEVKANPETDAIAIYAEGHEWTHFAKFAEGTWSSKLGDGIDISHVRFEDLEGAKYGRVVKILSRPKRVVQ